MFKAIKEFFVGKPKVEEEAPAQCPYKTEVVPLPEPIPEPVPPVSPAPVIETAPVAEEIKVTTVTLNDQITDAVTVTVKSDTVPTGSWPFPGGEKPVEQKKKRTFVKREEAATTKKPTPAIKVNKNKPRKKK